MSVEAAIPQIPEVPETQTTSDEPAPNLPAAVAPPEVPDVPSPVDEASSSSEPPQVDASAQAKRRGRPTGAKNRPKIERVSVKKVTIETPQPSAPPPSPASSTFGEPVRVPTPAPQLNLTEMLRETLRKMQAERQQQQSNLYANLARSGLR